MVLVSRGIFFFCGKVNSVIYWVGNGFRGFLGSYNMLVVIVVKLFNGFNLVYFFNRR